jgi:uncharacterized membrane protein
MATSLEHQRSKQPATRLAGPYGHPFHPVLVTIPIGAWIASFVFDLLSLGVDDGTAFVRGAAALLVLGIVGALVAAVFGFMDYSRLMSGTRAVRDATLHMLLNVGATVAMLVNYLLRRDELSAAETPTGFVVFSGVVLAVLAVSGWIGGHLSYTYGVRVADERTQAEGFTIVGRRNRVESGDGVNAPRVT